jgi:hypothetical protein
MEGAAMEARDMQDCSKKNTTHRGGDDVYTMQKRRGLLHCKNDAHKIVAKCWAWMALAQGPRKTNTVEKGWTVGGKG